MKSYTGIDGILYGYWRTVTIFAGSHCSDRIMMNFVRPTNVRDIMDIGLQVSQDINITINKHVVLILCFFLYVRGNKPLCISFGVFQ